MAEEKLLYNVYVWRWKPNGNSTPAVRVAEKTDFVRAANMVDAYLNKGSEWDAYMVEVSDDPGWSEEDQVTEVSR